MPDQLYRCSWIQGEDISRCPSWKPKAFVGGNHPSAHLSCHSGQPGTQCMAWHSSALDRCITCALIYLASLHFATSSFLLVCVSILQDGNHHGRFLWSERRYRSWSFGYVNPYVRLCVRGNTKRSLLTHLRYRLAVGHGIDEETQEPYFLVKNSWGAKWGDKGFVKFSRNSKNQFGMCSILVSPSLGPCGRVKSCDSTHCVQFI